jgi:hypothetical protein
LNRSFGISGVWYDGTDVNAHQKQRKPGKQGAINNKQGAHASAHIYVSLQLPSSLLLAALIRENSLVLQMAKAYG